MVRKKYGLNETVWVCIGAFPDNDPQEGKVVHIFELYGETQYVVEVPTSLDPLLEVRDWNTISEDGKRLNIWKNLI